MPQTKKRRRKASAPGTLPISQLVQLASPLILPSAAAVPAAQPKPQNISPVEKFHTEAIAILTNQTLNKAQKASELAALVVSYGPASSTGVDPKAEATIAAFTLLEREEHKALDTESFRTMLGEEVIRKCCGKVTTTTQPPGTESNPTEWLGLLTEQAPKLFAAAAITAPLLAAIPHVVFAVVVAVAPVVGTAVVAFKTFKAINKLFNWIRKYPDKRSTEACMDMMVGVIKAASSSNPVLSGKIAGAVVAAAELHLTGLPRSKVMIEKRAIEAAGNKAAMIAAVKAQLPGKLGKALNYVLDTNLFGRDRAFRRAR